VPPPDGRAPTNDEIVHTVADQLPVGVWVARAPGGEFVYANRAFREIMGMEARDDVALGEYAAPYGIHGRDGALYPEQRMPFVQALRARTTVIVDDIVIHRTDGGRVHIRASAKPIFDDAGEITHVVIAFIDISREVAFERSRAQAEANLSRAQRLESVGNLAAGIAHDFNNLLAVIRLLATGLRRTEHDPLRAEDLRRIDEVTESAAKLTRALLGFAGRGKNRSERVSVHRTVESVLEILERAIDKRIAIRTSLRAVPGEVVGDQSQLEQVIMNLVVNARDAMPEQGEIVVRTHDLVLDDAAPIALRRLRPGPHVVLEVSDTGTGIDPAIRDRIFEPYFTTKTTGSNRGTGLGLATVYGIVEAHGGAIEVVDNVPRGTIMRIVLPAAPPSAPPRLELVSAPEAHEGAETILLVEDEPLVRDAAKRSLERLGFRVLVAEDGVAAVETFRRQHGEIAAVVLDMVMPRMGGRSTYRALREVDPDVAVVLTTGYALNEEAQGILDLGVRVLVEKPYDADELSAAIAKAIGRSRR
jgi:two-component system cell cycle sensor histidine kinase/response regulator CckA